MREDSQESEENLPEPPVVMRRTRFFAAVRSCLLELRSRVDEGVAGFIAPAEADGDDDPTGFSRALLSKEERDELELAEALKKKALSDAIEGAFDEALESLGTMMYKVRTCCCSPRPSSPPRPRPPRLHHVLYRR